MTIQEYVSKINTRYTSGISTEHSYRGDLQNLLESLVPDVMVTNEPSRVACGAPDYIITRKNIPVGYIEAKDIGADLDNKLYKEQFDRYKASLSNLIITDYLTFRLFHDGVLVDTVILGNIEKGKVIGNTSQYDNFTNFIVDFSIQVGKTITSAEKLAKMMAGKARMLAIGIENALLSDEEGQTDVIYEKANNTLREQLIAFQQVLIHDIKPKDFADIYAQTITYGMFAARLHDPTLDTFSRQEAADLIPKSNPFLRKLFQYIAGYDLDDRLKWIVDALADIFRATDVAAILKNFGKATQQNDPMIHFYETFLGEYDPKLRKSRGVWYTPEPVVNFIVRAVDDILKTEFGLENGLADTSKTKVKVKIPTHDYRMKVDGQKGYTEVEQEVHKVQILDPAAGTGTFLAEIIKHIYKNFEGQQGIWNTYVDEHLIPRLNGFELLMASYAMAHLKLDLLLTETGYKPQKDQRLRVYLTNSLEEYHPDTGTLFAGWLSTEANEANHIKRDTPVMVVLGNPPYSVSSSNKSEWIQNLISDYKQNLNERKINLDDDYIKFIRFGQHFIDKNGEGVLAYISNNSFIDGNTHRQMRRNLLESFDKIYILDLHGNARKKEVCIDGSRDQNVFDIMQGVSINIFIKTKNKKFGTLGEVVSSDLYGLRAHKYQFLLGENISNIDWNKINSKEPNFFFVQKDFTQEKEYIAGFSIGDLFVEKNSGIQTKNDRVAIQFDSLSLKKILLDFNNLKLEELKKEYQLSDTSGWSAYKAQEEIKENNFQFSKILYRPFDFRNSIYTGRSGGFIGRSRHSTMKHLICGKNYSLLVTKKNRQVSLGYVFVANIISDLHVLDTAGDSMLVFPLYRYIESNIQQSLDINQNRQPNLNRGIVDEFASRLELSFANEKEDNEGTFAPIDILDYIYAVLHSPTYREKYKEFLKIDFPRVPCPKDANTFWQLVKLGGELRQIHLLESPVISQFITKYPVEGNNLVTKPRFDPDQPAPSHPEPTDPTPSTHFSPLTSHHFGKVWINESQYFEGVPQVSWEFYIGGYQPAQKWLKDRKGRVLNFEDILHYQKIVVALAETGRIMGEIDGLWVEY
ncbi:MAG: N-6 DNA methylase [Bacteroidetes bacterium]|nr:N-6 DNA methylase [Bacteroidota bacterium]